MATNKDPSPNSNAGPLLLPEIGPDGLPRESPLIAYTEKIIEEGQLQLRKYIEENYSKIRDVERELANLAMEMKLTAGPKKAALEHLRKKVELSTERIGVAKLEEERARKAWEAASKALKEEEVVKQKLCEDLNNLVLESSNAQYARLEELKRRLEALNPCRSSTSIPSDKDAIFPACSTTNKAAPPLASPTTLQSNVGGVNATNTTTQLPSSDTEGRTKKKSMIQGRGKGIGAVPKGRGSAAPEWTGAGFDTGGRS